MVTCSTSFIKKGNKADVLVVLHSQTFCSKSPQKNIAKSCLGFLKFTVIVMSIYILTMCLSLTIFWLSEACGTYTYRFFNITASKCREKNRYF